MKLSESLNWKGTIHHLWRVDTRRLGGLDLLRSAAIVLVVLAHYSMVRPFPLPFNFFGWVGVDLFFVLSGYLIGGQLFNLHLKHSSIPFKTFYLRRFLRTLPNYYVVLALFVIIPGLSSLSFKERIVPLWQYVTFTHNLFLQMPFFQLSWSLCVEEHFYLLLPVLIWLCVKLRIRWVAWAFVLVILSQILLRAAIAMYGVRVLHLVDQRDILAYLARVYYPTYCRLDGLTIGVALAALRCYRPALWSRLVAQGNRLLFAGVVGLCAAVLLIWSKSYVLSGATIFTLLGVSFGLMTAAALSPGCILSRVKSRVVTLIAELAYSIYLTHIIAFYVAGIVLTRSGLGKYDVITFIVTMLTVLAASLILFTLVERPFLLLRDQRFGYQPPTASNPGRPVDKSALTAPLLDNRQTQAASLSWNQPPRVSVIIPTNSRPHMLVRAVQSAQRAGSSVEVIVVDDGSTDQTAEVCQKLEGIKYVRLEDNQGVAGARNVGILASSSEYVAFLDDDDLRLPGTLDKQVDVLLRNKQAGFVCSQMLMADQEGRMTGEVTGPKSSGENAFWELLELDFPVMPLSVVIRKECFNNVGLLNANLSGIDEWDVLVRIAELYPVLVLNEPVGIYRQPTPYSGQGSSGQAQLLSKALRHQLQLLRLPRVKMAPLAEQKEIRRRAVNRVVNTLLLNAARAIPQGAVSFACRNIFAALRLSPSHALRVVRPRRLALLSKAQR